MDNPDFDDPYQALRWAVECLESDAYGEVMEKLPHHTRLALEGVSVAIPLLLARIEQLELFVASHIASSHPLEPTRKAGTTHGGVETEPTEPTTAAILRVWNAELAAFLTTKLDHVDHPVIGAAAELLPEPPDWMDEPQCAARPREGSSGSSSDPSESSGSSSSGQ